MVPFSSMLAGAGPFLYSAALVGAAGLASVVYIATAKGPRSVETRRDYLRRIPRCALVIALVHAMLGLAFIYRVTGYNFARADFQTVFAGISVLLVSMASGLLVVAAAMLGEATLARRREQG